MRRLLLLFASFILASLLVAEPASSDEFRGKWWHYYQRGMGYTDEKKLDEAVKDLKKAIDMRDKDQRMARTYGMHFIDYFPHRELGIAYLGKGSLDAAIRELEESVRSEESAKGVYYLNAARKAKLSGGKQALPAPLEIGFEKPREAVITRDRSLRVSAKVASGAFVSRITVNGVAYPVEEAKQKVLVNQDVPLEDDTREIRITAEDLAGNRTVAALPVTVKREGPVLTVSSITNERRDQKNYARVIGEVSDGIGIQSVVVGGRQVQANGARAYTIDLLVERRGADSLLVRALDVVGNETVADVDLSKIIAEEVVAQQRESRAALERQAREAAEKERLALAAAEKERVAREAAENERLAQVAAERERQARATAERERARLARAEADRLAAVAAETARQAALTAERERQATEREALALAARKIEQERQARAAAEERRLAREQAEQERLARLKAEAELKLSQAAAKAQAERMQREEDERLRLAEEKAEQQRQAAEAAERSRLAREKLEQEEAARAKAEALEQARIAAEKAKAERIVREEAEKSRLAAAKAEKERRAREAAEAQRLARQQAEQRELARQAAEAAERTRLVREQSEREEAARLKAEADLKVLLAAQKAETDRLAREEAERNRLLAEDAEKHRQERLAEERIRLAREKLQQEELARATAESERQLRAAAERAEAERMVREEAEASRLAAEKAQKERLAREAAEVARQAREKAEQLELARVKAEAELKVRLAAEKAEAERVAREQAERSRLAAEKAEQERLAKAAAERSRLARQKLEQEELARLKAEAQRQVRLAAEKAEAERLAREEAERGRMVAAKAEKERLAREDAERKRLAREKAEQEELARAKAEAARKAYLAAEQDDAEQRAAAGGKPAAGQPPVVVERDKLKAITDEQKLSLALSTDTDKQLTPGMVLSGEGTKVYAPAPAAPGARAGAAAKAASVRQVAACTKPDREKPVLNIKDPGGIPFVFVDAYPLDGMATDNCLVDRVVVNGRDVSIKKGKQVYFSSIVKLASGDNSITLDVYDQAGNKSSAQIQVNRKIPSVLQNGSRMSVLVLPFDYDASSSSSVHLASDYLIGAMADQHRFMVVERQKLKQLMAERKMSLALAEDNEKAAQFGKVAAAEAIIVNSARETDHSFEVTSRIVDTETSEVMSVLDVYTEDTSSASVKTLMTALAAKIARNFPVVEGVVISRDDDRVLTDLGAPQMVRQRTGAIIYRRGKEIKHPTTGKSLGFDTEKLGEGYLDEVQENFSKLRLGDRYRDKGIQPSDLVVTK